MRNTRPYTTVQSTPKNVGNEKMIKVIIAFLNKIMREEAIMQAGAGFHEKSTKRKAHLNGSKKRRLITRYGPAELSKPQLRETGFETSIFDKYDRAEKAIVATICLNYTHGISTRKMKKVLAELGVTVSKSAVSRICEELDIAVQEFLNRPLDVTPYLFVDATYVRVLDFEMKRYVTKPVFVAMGVNHEGYREILGAKVMDREDEAWWTVFFQELKDRGMTGVELVVSDGHRGIKAAVPTMFPGASWQYCHVHFRRNMTKTVGIKQRKQFNDLLNDAMESPELLDALVPDLEKQGFTRAAEMIMREEQNQIGRAHV